MKDCSKCISSSDYFTDNNPTLSVNDGTRSISRLTTDPRNTDIKFQKEFTNFAT